MSSNIDNLELERALGSIVEAIRPIRIQQSLRRMAGAISNRVRTNIDRNFRRNNIGQLKEQLLSATPIFIYQMGKVGSTAIYQSLKGLRLPNAIVHSHTFGAFDSNPMVRELFEFKRKSQAKIKIISLTREPVSRNISAFFQNLKRDTGIRPNDIERYSPHELKRKFLSRYAHEIPLIWFDDQLKKNFNVDVYDQPIDGTGILHFSGNCADVLILKSEIPDEVKAQAISKFLDLSEFNVIRRNESGSKYYASFYAAIRKAKLPLDHLFYLASSKYMQHFYKREMREIIHSWTDTPIG